MSKDSTVYRASDALKLLEEHDNELPTLANQLSDYLSYGVKSNQSISELLNTGIHSSLDFLENNKITELESEIRNLRNQNLELIKDFDSDLSESKEKQTALKRSLDEQAEKEKLRHLIDRVGASARAKLLDGDKELLKIFHNTSLQEAFVVSIDLRRSTELMLKARTPSLFADFITGLAEELKQIVLNNYGVFDKFTGDGILAFFPIQYSGNDAGLLALDAATACHQAFDKHYREHRHCFVSVLKDTGLGIGIDYGFVSLVKMTGELTVVGTPVVYACRLGGAEAGTTLVNQPAYEWFIEFREDVVNLEETYINFKHEGDTIAYLATRSTKEVENELPKWLRNTGEKL